MRRWILIAVAVAAGVSALTARPAPTRADAAVAPAVRSPQLRHDGRWLVDPEGRVVLLHGVNAVWKRPPYVASAEPGGFTAADADFLAANGFNAVRLGVLFAGVMPRPGVIDQTYLDQIDRVVQLLASRHIWVLLDFHQDQYDEKFQGEGFPAWSVYDDGLPDDARYGFPGNYFGSVALDVTYDNLWANHAGLWERYRDAWKAVAAEWVTQPYLMGYELINEPWPGTAWPTCIDPVEGCPAFDATLQRFQDEARAGIREVDRSNLVWFEGSSISNYGVPNHLGDTPIRDPEIGYSWHAYCVSSAGFSAAGVHNDEGCPQEEQYAIAGAEKTDARLGAGFLVTEFGGGDDLNDVARVAASADQHLVGWMYWSYKTWADPTGGGGAESMFENDADLSTLKQAKANVLIRPYADAVAGVPLSMAFDPATKVFSLSFAPRAASGPTEVFVPARHYANGYVVRVNGGHTISSPGASNLEVVADAGATRVDLELRPAEATARAASETSGARGGPTSATVAATRTSSSLAATGQSSAWFLIGMTSLAVALGCRRPASAKTFNKWLEGSEIRARGR